MDELTKKSYKLRRIVIEAVYRSSSGHIGGDLSVVDILNVLYNKIMNVSPETRTDPNRDRLDEAGKLKEEFAIDGVHMWPEAYALVLEALKPYLEAL